MKISGRDLWWCVQIERSFTLTKVNVKLLLLPHAGRWAKRIQQGAEKSISQHPGFMQPPWLVVAPAALAVAVVATEQNGGAG